VFLPPEAFLGLYSFKGDIWACGVTLYWLLSGTLPFKNEVEICSGLDVSFAASEWDSISFEAKDLVCCCRHDFDLQTFNCMVFKLRNLNMRMMKRIACLHLTLQIARMLRRDPESRYLISDVFAHAWMQEERDCKPISDVVQDRLLAYSSMNKVKKGLLQV
jgi:serine/threonine protein kinase